MTSNVTEPGEAFPPVQEIKSSQHITIDLQQYQNAILKTADTRDLLVIIRVPSGNLTSQGMTEQVILRKNLFSALGNKFPLLFFFKRRRHAEGYVQQPSSYSSTTTQEPSSYSSISLQGRPQRHEQEFITTPEEELPTLEHKDEPSNSEQALTITPEEELPTLEHKDEPSNSEQALTTSKKTSIASTPRPHGFQVFLCHNTLDKPAVREIAQQLFKRRIYSWFDERMLQPGLPWQQPIEEQIKKVPAAAVFIGRHGLGRYQFREINAFLRRSAKQKFPIIPVFLSNAHEELELPSFLEEMHWVDFRKKDPDPMELLIWGITGRNPNSSSSKDNFD